MPSPVKQPSVATPPDRRPRSIRRTLSTQYSFPTGPLGDISATGRGRDLHTGAATDDRSIVDEQITRATLSPEHQIMAAQDGSAARPLTFLEGAMLGKATREAVRRELPDQVERRSLLVRAWEELSASAFLAPGSWFAWINDAVRYKEVFGDASRLERPVLGICISYAPGSIAVTAEGKTNHELIARHRLGLALHHGDPWAWHELEPLQGPQFLRFRYIDVWEQDGRIAIATGFQDSATLENEDEMRGVYHEYRADALIDPDGYVLEDIRITPGALPFTTCVAAPGNTDRLIGRPVSDFGRQVPAALGGVMGCTHLNEALKALQDVPMLAAELRRRNRGN